MPPTTLKAVCDEARLLLFLPLSLVLFAYERTLLPNYGWVPTNYLLRQTYGVSIILAALLPVNIAKSQLFLVSGLLLAITPNATYWAAVLSARVKDPIYGPLVTHVVTLVPLVYMVASLMMESKVGNAVCIGMVNLAEMLCMKPINVGFHPGLLSSRLIATLACFLAISGFVKSLLERLPHINNVSDSDIFLALSWLFISFAIIAPVPSSKPQKVHSTKSHISQSTSLYGPQRCLVAFAAFTGLCSFIRPLLHSPVLPHPLETPYTHPNFPLRIHFSVQSITGLISVGEALPPPNYDGELDTEMHSVRYLRASHSILGGVWLGSKIGILDDAVSWTDSFGTPLGDSIYAAFILQEAVRLVNSTERGEGGAMDTGLIIGLGTGIAATAFQRHNISTTIVEIDPAVYEASRLYFGLPYPGPGNIFLEDARAWVARRRAEITGKATDRKLYDFVVHDCFSGGGVPQHIFTIEFWKDLKAIMYPDGIVAVNFAGQIDSKSSRAVLRTLETTFSQCRAYHDAFQAISEEQYEAEFVNIVFFCTSSIKPLTFRRSRISDYLGSPLRRHVLSSLPSREVNLEIIRHDPSETRNLILTDSNNPLARWQDESALHHWSLMRKVLKDVFWETY